MHNRTCILMTMMTLDDLRSFCDDKAQGYLKLAAESTDESVLFFAWKAKQILKLKEIVTEQSQVKQAFEDAEEIDAKQPGQLPEDWIESMLEEEGDAIAAGVKESLEQVLSQVDSPSDLLDK